MTRPARPASRILLLDADARVLLFRFDPPDRPPFWCTPGGALEPGESHPAAARRELAEECGIVADCGPERFRRQVEFVSLEGVAVEADERYFQVQVSDTRIDTSGHTTLERQVMRKHRWFARDEIDGWPETIYPRDLGRMIDALSDDVAGGRELQEQDGRDV